MDDKAVNDVCGWLEHRCTDDMEYMSCVRDIFESNEFRKMENFIQHGTTTTMQHCVAVSYVSYKICRKYNLDYRSAARAGLLHDMFLYDWHTYHRDTGKRFHGLTHPGTALRNAEKVFNLSDAEKNIILRHMWPLTIIPPKTKEGFAVVYADKYCTILETVTFLRRFVEFISAGNCM